MDKRVMMSGAAAVVVAATLGAGYYLGKHNAGAAYADEASTPQTIAAAADAPSVPGLCVLSQNAVYANAKIGQAATARYRELNDQLRGQLAPQQQAIQEDAKKLEAAKATMPAAEYQKKTEDLAQRIQALRDANGVDSRELEATRVKALHQIATLANPIISDAYKSHRCGALFSRDTMLVGNPGMDITPVVVAGLNAKQTSISFDLEKLPTIPATPTQTGQ